jgi:hypothetical protein
MVSDATETTRNSQYAPREFSRHESLHTSCLVPKIQRDSLLSWPRADLAHCRVRSLERQPLRALLQSPGRSNSWGVEDVKILREFGVVVWACTEYW